MRRIRRMIYRHYNCLPWLIVGIQILVDGNISRWQYGLCWISTLFLIWHYAPNKTYAERGKKVVDITDHEKVV